MLWIALHLPLLSLESFAATLSGVDPAAAGSSIPTAARPLALLDAHHIVSANGAAQALGVKPGLKRATALALAPQITLGQANPLRDAEALLAVAHHALAFTPQVVVPRIGHPADSPHTVLLEVDASLRYFGGLPRLKQRLHLALEPLGHAVHCTSAPTAQGAALLAREKRQMHCPDLAATRKALDGLPVWLLGPGREHWEALQGMGLRTLADLRSLPRAGLARRFGEPLLVELDCALGLRPDPRSAISLPPSFESRLELFARADTSEQLLVGAGMLLARLVAWLSGQHAFVRRFTLVMQHEKHARRSAETPTTSTLEVALAEPSRDHAHLLSLLRERLGRMALPAPTLELQMQASDIARRAAPNQELFPTPHSEGEGLTRLIERLQARLGADQVQRLVPIDEHRPERADTCATADAGHSAASAAWRAPRIASALPGSSGGSSGASNSAGLKRPVWMLPRPEALPERQSRPLLEGEPLQLLSGPERIEAGWWDDGLAERDYFIAQAGDGALVWIYRARLPLDNDGENQQGWFMQGRFG